MPGIHPASVEVAPGAVRVAPQRREERPEGPFPEGEVRDMAAVPVAGPAAAAAAAWAVPVAAAPAAAAPVRVAAHPEERLPAAPPVGRRLPWERT